MSAMGRLQTLARPDKLPRVRKRLNLLCATCALTFGCQDAEVRQPQLNEMQRMEQEHAEWASSQPRPSNNLVDRAEELLAKEPCVGQLDRWSRFYAFNYDFPDKALYTEIVDFRLEEVGSGVSPGRHVTEPNSWVNIDDRPIRMAGGDYDIAQDRIRIAYCGNNMGGPPRKTDVHTFDEYWDELDRRRANYRSARAP